MKRLNETTIERDDGCIVVAEPTVFKPLDRFDPPKRQELIVLLDDPREPELLMDFAEWNGKVWHYVGDYAPVVVPVKYFAELCTLPTIATETMEVAA
jgi:hypothetical protein